MEQTINLIDVYKELQTIRKNMVTRAEMTSLVESISVASNQDTMSQLQKSEADIKSGRIKKVTSAKDF